MVHFRINEFLVRSEVPLPGTGVPAGDEFWGLEELLTVRRGNLAEFSAAEWLGQRGGGTLRAYDVGSGILVCVADALRFHVDRDGKAITLDFDATSEYAVAAAGAFVANLGMSLTTLFRGRIPLHAASFNLAGRRVAVMAPSGAGKTTLLWQLLDHGARFASDDIVPAWRDGGKVYAASSGSLHAKLARSVLEDRGLELSSYRPVFPGGDEFWMPIPAAERVEGTQPLSAVFLLKPGFRPDLQDSVVTTRLRGGTAMGALMQNTQGLWAAYSMLDARNVFANCRDFVELLPVYQLEYHRDRTVLPTLSRAINAAVGND